MYINFVILNSNNFIDVSDLSCEMSYHSHHATSLWSKNANLPQMWMVSYVVDIALSVTHLGKVIRGHFDLVLGILNIAFKYGPDRIEQKQLRDNILIIVKDT